MDNPEIDSDGNKRWRDANGKYHRDDGPAVEDADGHKEWYQHGRQHREDGPAIKWANGIKEWWLNNRHLSFDEWLDQVDISDEDKVMMTLQYG
jgi:hypothetical protein